MTNRDIYSAAVCLAGETSPADNPDYSLRAPSLLAMVYAECAFLDAAYREANNLEEGSWSPCVSVNLDAVFPLCDVFSAPAANGLAALLVIDENAALAETMYQRFSSLIEEIRRGLPATSAPITDLYHMI